MPVLSTHLLYHCLFVCLFVFNIGVKRKNLSSGNLRSASRPKSSQPISRTSKDSPGNISFGKKCSIGESLWQFNRDFSVDETHQIAFHCRTASFIFQICFRALLQFNKMFNHSQMTTMSCTIYIITILKLANSQSEVLFTAPISSHHWLNIAGFLVRSGDIQGYLVMSILAPLFCQNRNHGSSKLGCLVQRT